MLGSNEFNSGTVKMSYSRSKKLTDSEKRLQALKSQLYGKERETTSNTFRFDSSGIKENGTPSQSANTNTSYLRHDLIKTFILATFTLAAQLVIYFGLQRGLFKF